MMAGTRLPRRERGSNPYCEFKSDSERRLALRSRDIRLVLIATVGALGAMPAATHAWSWLMAWVH